MKAIKKIINGCVKGHRFQVPGSIHQMNQRVKQCNWSAPWAGNQPGQVMSRSYFTWQEQVYGLVDYDYENDSYEYEGD